MENIRLIEYVVQAFAYILAGIYLWRLGTRSKVALGKLFGLMSFAWAAAALCTGYLLMGKVGLVGKTPALVNVLFMVSSTITMLASIALLAWCVYTKSNGGCGE